MHQQNNHNLPSFEGKTIILPFFEGKNHSLYNARKAIIATLIYENIFSYPLTGDQLWRFLHADKSFFRKDFLSALHSLPRVQKADGFYYLRGNRETVLKRRQRGKISQEKYLKAKKVARFLSFLPTIQLIAVSGSLSMRNAKENDDIDLFFVCVPHSVWITRFFVTTLLRVLRLGRVKGKGYAKNKICPNMYLSASNLVFKRQNLYVAHEIAQLQILVNKNSTHEAFLHANSWIHTYLVNVPIKRVKIKKFRLSRFLVPLELLLYKLQFGYMRSAITREEVRRDFIAFHPTDMEKKILRLYTKNLSKYYSISPSVQAQLYVHGQAYRYPKVVPVSLSTPGY